MTTIPISPDTARAIATVSGGLVPDLDPADRDDVLIVAEVTIDAGRLTLNGYPDADAEIRDLIRRFDYPRVLDAVSELVET